MPALRFLNLLMKSRASLLIAHIAKKGKRIEHNFFTIRYIYKSGVPFHSFIICSKRVAKQAVQRNTIRRRIREVLRKEFSKNLSGYSIVLYIKPAAKSISSKELQEAFYHVFHLS